MKFLFAQLAVLFVLFNPLFAQPDHYNYNTLGQSNSMPWNLPAGKQVQILYQPGAFAQPSPAQAGPISSLSFLINQNLGPWTYSDLTIKLGQTSATALPTTGFYTGAMDTVFYRANASLTGTSNQWMTIALDNAFYYDPSLSLILEIAHCGAPGASGFSACFTPVGNVTRCWSTGGCPFVYSTWSNQVYHMGVNMGTTGMAESANGRSAFMISQEAGRLHVSVSQTGERTVNLYVADMLGSVVYRKENFTVADHAELIIDCWQFKPGVYTVTMQSHDGGSTQKIFIGN